MRVLDLDMDYFMDRPVWSIPEFRTER